MRAKTYQVVLKSLVEHPRWSDRHVATVAGVSQPTVTRIRRKLEEGGYLYFTAIPNFSKLGFEIVAFTKMDPSAEVSHDDAVVFVANGVSTTDGRGQLVISVHKNFTAYADFLTRNRGETCFILPITEKPIKLDLAKLLKVETPLEKT